MSEGHSQLYLMLSLKQLLQTKMAQMKISVATDHSKYCKD